tara:strand:+ start:193 stop:375 length:183 start_codon:yes stop_codon:yes gene_type:complete
MNKIRKVKIDLFRGKLHKYLFELMKPHLTEDQRIEAIRSLMLMSNEEVQKAKKDFLALIK